MSTESVFLTSVIDAYERRDVGCYNIPGAFLHADSDEDVTMILKGKLAELMVHGGQSEHANAVHENSKGTLRTSMKRLAVLPEVGGRPREKAVHPESI